MPRKFLNGKQVGEQYWGGSTTIDIASALNTYNSLRYYPGYDNGAGGGNCIGDFDLYDLKWAFN